MIVTIPCAFGELVDKLSILRIKLDKIHNANAQEIIKTEYKLLLIEYDRVLDSLPNDAINQLETLQNKLQSVNLSIWNVEDDIRQCESESNFDDKFIQLARQVYIQNDLRASIKKQINVLLNSSIVEVKSYTNYQR